MRVLAAPLPHAMCLPPGLGVAYGVCCPNAVVVTDVAHDFTVACEGYALVVVNDWGYVVPLCLLSAVCDDVGAVLEDYWA